MRPNMGGSEKRRYFGLLHQTLALGSGVARELENNTVSPTGISIRVVEGCGHLFVALPSTTTVPVRLMVLVM